MEADKRSRILSLVYRWLLIFLAFLALVFIVGTVYGVFFRNAPPKNDQITREIHSGDGNVFTGIGRLRIPAKSSVQDIQQGMVIIFVSFVYYPEDRTFSEELALRVGEFREIVMDYIGSFPAAELQNLSEESMKAELLRRFNAILRLGQLETMYFSDFMVVG
jgi:flagellar basal body-associated protein FliL